ncbi:MAG: hypothetical protein KY468_03485 [Armatimonadetes bacterium]|nr:hypothetical protein [Armatimonadota bacterium]
MSDLCLTLTPAERMDYFLSEARRQLQVGAYRMAMTWAFHARQLAGDNPIFREQADDLITAARRAA